MSAIVDLRHITSFTTLGATNRHSQHIRSSPARSPSSIPSSPTSVHSSSSAIFERDIEPLAPASPQIIHHPFIANHHPPDPHRIPRSRTTEQIEHAVPSVLDSAAAILASTQSPTDVAVVAPVPRAFPGSGFASPIGSYGSRSPSPTAIHARNSLLLSAATTAPQNIPPGTASRSVSGSRSHSGSPPRVRPNPPTIHTVGVTPAVAETDPSNTAPPSIVTPTSAYFTVVDDGTSVVSFPDTGTNRETGEAPLPPDHSVPPSSPVTATPTPAATSSFTTPGQRRSPCTSSAAAAATASKRLSFISYADLLTSTPTSTLPLTSLTTAASAIEPPPRITSVAGACVGTGSYGGGALNFSAVATTPPRGTSLRGFALDPLPQHSLQQPQRRDSHGGVAAVLEDLGAGGEWEREGFGRGLEERLDVLYRRSSAGSAGPGAVGLVSAV